MCDVSPLGCDEPKPSRRDALPARVADLAAEGERVLEMLLRRVDVALEEVDLGSKRLRPGLEGRQASCPDVLERLVEDAPGVGPRSPQDGLRPARVRAC